MKVSLDFSYTLNMGSHQRTGAIDSNAFFIAYFFPRLAVYDDMNGWDDWSYNEGCLSIPKIREDILRPEDVTIEYLDENFQLHTETFNGITARIIQHEYDHIEGKLFIDYLKPLRKKMLRGKLNDISKGKIKVDYKMVFPK
jgi:peptide deformylase